MAADEELRIGQARGPYDIEALDTPAEELANSHLDLGAVLVPVVEGGQVTVEMTQDHQPEAVYLVTAHGRITVTAFAAPKSPGLWREVVRELAASLRDDGATTSVEDGHWGREVVAEVPGGVHRFIGVDGPRWMVRCVASGPPETTTELAQLARAVLAESVIRRGTEPAPPREMLPLVLPPVLAEQVSAAQAQMLAGGPGAEGAPAPAPNPPPVAPTADDEAGRVPGGALDQLAQATVIRDEPPVTDSGVTNSGVSDVIEGVPGSPSTQGDDDMATSAGADAVPPSAGSAMQRFRRRRK